MEKREKKPVCKKWWVWLIAIVVVIGVTGAGSSDSDGVEVGEQTVAETEVNSTEKKIEEVKEIYAVGEEVKLKDNILIVNSVE
ncbi:hypothetical protein H9X78_16935, partial [Clostridium saudiense]|nr:hypothetical protein [Clostridium saudiense]